MIPSFKSDIKQYRGLTEGYDNIFTDPITISFKELRRISEEWKLIVSCPWKSRGIYSEEIKISLVGEEEFKQKWLEKIKIKYTKDYGYLISHNIVYGLRVKRYSKVGDNKDFCYSMDSGVMFLPESGSLEVIPVDMKKGEFYYYSHKETSIPVRSSVSKIKQLSSQDIIDIYQTRPDISHVTVGITFL